MAELSSLFVGKKDRILKDLSIPLEDYTDLSPKGSVDVGIQDLIDDINGMEGLVTTSSCAGRISVFLEGSKEDVYKEGSEGLSSQVIVPGGKGNGGRWLYVSHDPVQQLGDGVWEEGSILKLLGMSSQVQSRTKTKPRTTRFVKFQFEPMILHIMAASLRHAQPVLAAAINAGFRESGVQSLKNLDDPHAFPMVAVRSSGLSLSSLVGFADDDTSDGEVRAMVSEEYLHNLLEIANERFKANKGRVARFRSHLLQDKRGEGGGKKDRIWETKETRRNRLRTLGLDQQDKSSATKSRDEMRGLGQSSFEVDGEDYLGALSLGIS
ncbi:hypothetical protein MMC30_009204 [Trapelia coarctata]|nr:hypothetical protein [Trapelia coarctata]